MMATWRDVADALAHRMQHHAFCDTHKPEAPDLANCPFCNDRAAYQMWQWKTRRAAALRRPR